MFLKELEDYPWFPTQLRKMQLEFVGWISVQLRLYRPVLQLFNRFPTREWLDLGSGSGWPAYYIQKNAAPPIHYTLSDLYPDSVSDEVKKWVKIQNAPLNLLEFDPEQGKQYTLFNAFHHFTPDQQFQLIKKMKEAKAGCIIAEVLEPSLLSFIQVSLAAFVVQPLTVWAIRPFSMVRLLTTYIIPIQLITVAWDGWLSVLKSKSRQSYHKLLGGLAGEEYSIEIMRIPQLQGNLIVIIAKPILA
jgi:SAM-dependent methyltransferase